MDEQELYKNYKEARETLSMHHDFINCGDVSDLLAIQSMNDMETIYTATELKEVDTLAKQASNLNRRSYDLCQKMDDLFPAIKDGLLPEQTVTVWIQKAEAMKKEIEKMTALCRPLIDKLPMEIKANLD